MEFITLTKSNIDKEHICCSIADKKGQCGAASKKAWLRDRFDEGLVFKKANIRGKVFIEYLPAEKAWCPIVAPNYMFINCLWVSGQYKGQGYSSLLLDDCIGDSKSEGKSGIVILSSNKKKPYLADKKYLLHKGFEVCDNALPYYELMYLTFDSSTEKPRFNDSVRVEKIKDELGFSIYYSNQCPFCEDYVSAVKRYADDNNIQLQAIKYETYEQAQNSPVAWTTYSVFKNGNFITHEILTIDKFKKLVD